MCDQKRKLQKHSKECDINRIITRGLSLVWYVCVDFNLHTQAGALLENSLTSLREYRSQDTAESQP